MEKQKAVEYEAETLRIQQQVAKAKAHVKILEVFNEEGKAKVSKNFLHAEDGNIPSQQQKGYEYSGLANKLTSQSSTYHSLPVDNRPSSDLSDEYRSPRLSYDITPKSELNHRGGHLGEMNFHFHLTIVKQLLMSFVSFYDNKQHEKLTWKCLMVIC